MNKATGLLVALSAGGDKNELAEHGLGEDHVNELMVRLARKLLRNGHRLAYGGTLGDPDKPLTEHLIDAALRWSEEDDSTEGEESQNEERGFDVTKPDTWPTVNYSAWPFNRSVSDERRAELVGVCSFLDVEPSGVAESELDELADQWYKKPQARLYAANALTQMRELSTEETDIRIVWAGKVNGALGWMAGILEEVSFSIAAGKALVVLGGFGGCGRVIADFLVDPNAKWPEALCLEASADEQRDALLDGDQRQALDDRFAEIQRLLTQYRKSLHRETEIAGVECELLREALGEPSTRKAIGIAAKAVQQHLEHR